MKFIIFVRRSVFRGRQWHFRAVANNNEIIFQSEGYRRSGDCEKTVRLIIEKAGAATIHYEAEADQ
jgi:uncharacterized protein YegP (UPF0339 family)